MLKSPVLIEVAKRNTVSETITHRVHPVAAEAKRALLVKLLKSADFNQVLVFTRTKIETNRWPANCSGPESPPTRSMATRASRSA
jgi:ATP-dependent RNA helicase RhlE